MRYFINDLRAGNGPWTAALFLAPIPLLTSASSSVQLKIEDKLWVFGKQNWLLWSSRRHFFQSIVQVLYDLTSEVCSYWPKTDQQLWNILPYSPSKNIDGLGWVLGINLQVGETCLYFRLFYLNCWFWFQVDSWLFIHLWTNEWVSVFPESFIFFLSLN